MNIVVFESRAALREALLDSLKHALPGCTLVGACDRDEALRLCLEQRPQAAVLDADFSLQGGVTAAYALKQLLPHMALVMFGAGPPLADDWSQLGPLDAFVPEQKLRAELAPTLSRLLGI